MPRVVTEDLRLRLEGRKAALALEVSIQHQGRMGREKVPEREWMGLSRRTKKRRAYRQNILKLAQAQRAWAASNYEAAAAAERVLSAATEAAMGGNLEEETPPPPPAADEESTTEDEPTPTPSEEETTEEEDSSTTETETQEEEPRPSTSRMAAEVDKLLKEERDAEVDMEISDGEARKLLELPPKKKRAYRLKGPIWSEMKIAAKKPLEEMVGRRNERQILVRDMKKLTCGQKLNDEVINNYLALLQEEVESKKNFGVLSVSSLFYGPALKKGFEFRAYWDVQRRWSNYQKILFPIFHPSLEPGATGHWGLVVADQQKQEICYWDSLESGREKAQRICQVITSYLNKRREAEGRQVLNWRRVEMPADLPSQDDGKSCGLFVLMYGRMAAIEDNFYTRLAAQDLNCLRLAIAAELFSGKIIYDIKMNRL